jgi:hypothetical protein
VQREIVIADGLNMGSMICWPENERGKNDKNLYVLIRHPGAGAHEIVPLRFLPSFILLK